MADEGRWVTINGAHVLIKDEKNFRDKETLKSLRKDLMSKRNDLLSKHMASDGSIPVKYAKQFESMNNELDEIEYELFSQLSPVVNKDENWKGNGITALTREQAGTVREDLLKNKQMYLAVASAAHGVWHSDKTFDTLVDKFYLSNPVLAYSIFNPTREMLKKQFGDTITLYRAGTKQTKKVTVNMTSTKQNAEQYAKAYNSSVTAVKVPIDSILAVNISRTGAYEEFIILNKGK